eukprot:723630-Alexandrium_andersonii.AAC.1
MQFWNTPEGAMFRFVPLHSHSAEDAGFFIMGWNAVRFQNEVILISGNTAMAMGSYFVIELSGMEIK